MSSCNTFPTQTRTDEVVSNSLSTSTTTRVTTLPPSTTTFTLFPSCTATTTCTVRPVVTTSQIPGGSSTFIEVVTITVPITSTQVATLWGTSCVRTAQDPTPTPTPTDTWTPPTSTWVETFSTPPPSVFVTSSASTEANGNVTPVIVTITSTAAPVLVSQPPTSESNGSGNSDNSRNLGPIIGGVVGGVVGLAIIIFIIWFIIRRRRRWDDIFDNDDDVATVAAAAQQREKENQADPNPKPYHYGLVGHTKSSSLTSPPSSPPPTTATMPSDNGYEPSHHRHNSATPLLGIPVGMVAHGTTTSLSPRPPSSSASTQGYGPPPQDGNAYTPGFGQHPAPSPQGQQIWDPHLLYGPAALQQQPQPVGFASGFVGATNPTNVATSANARRMSHDVETRAVSPVSFQEQRILQIANGEPDFGPQSPGAPPSVSSGTTSSEPQRDGKGRMMTAGGKTRLVHLDGGRYQDSGAGSSSAAGPAPPAYSE